MDCYLSSWNSIERSAVEGLSRNIERALAMSVLIPKQLSTLSMSCYVVNYSLFEFFAVSSVRNQASYGFTVRIKECLRTLIFLLVIYFLFRKKCAVKLQLTIQLLEDWLWGKYTKQLSSLNYYCIGYIDVMFVHLFLMQIILE